MAGTFNTGLSEAQISNAFSRALGDYTDAQIDTKLAQKQDTIADLAAIRSGAEAGATAVQPAALSAETSAREAADNEMQTAIAQQETEIGVVANAGAKNFAVPFDPTSTSDIIVTCNANGSYTFECADVSEDRAILVANIGDMPSGTYKISGVTGGSSSTYMLGLYDASATAKIYQHTNPEESYTGDVSGFSLRVLVIAGYSGTFTVYPMIRPASITDSTFVPYALPNPTLTPAAIKAVDGGDKNKLHYDGISDPSGDTANISFSCSGDTITITGSTSSNAAWCYLKLDGSIIVVNDFCNGKYFLSSERTGSGAVNILAYEAGAGQFAEDSGKGVVIPDKSTSNAVRIMVNIPKGATVNITLKIMICTAADYAISPAFVPYRPSWQEMWEMIQALQSGGASTQSTASLMSTTLGKSAEITAEGEPEESEMR